MRYKRLIGLVLFITCFYLPLFAIPVKGEDVGYSVKAIIPDNQVDKTKSYFDLRVKPNDTQKLQAVIYNQGQEEITVRLSVNPATTNSNGLIIYEETDELDPSMKTPLPDILKFDEKTVTIPAGTEKTVSATLHTPKEKFDGIILGGLHFEKIHNETENKTEGVNIENKYSYVIGVQLSQSDKDVPPELHFQKAYADLTNHRPAVTAQIQNSAPTLISGLTVHAKVYEKNQSKPIKEKIQENISMAPNSHMKINIDWDNQPLKDGSYTIKLTAKHGKDTWEWEEQFNIAKEEAKQINTAAAALDNTNQTHSWYIAGLAILGIIIIILVFYIRKLKRKQTVHDS